jgi:NADH-quinone oxidoreductase subunit M
MILSVLIFSLFFGGIIAWISGIWSDRAPRWISLIPFLLNLVIIFVVWGNYLGQIGLPGTAVWIIDVNLPWIPQLGINYHLGLDGFSLLMVLLTNFLGLISILISWKNVENRVGFFYFQLLWVLAAITGIFLALDLILFYFFWEIMLIPLYFLIGIWGQSNRIYATIKFFIFTQGSSLLMLVAILALYFVHGNTSGDYTFDYLRLIGTSLPSTTAFWIMMGFFIAFAVKLPSFPLHSWLPDAHAEAPASGSVDIAGLVIKVGAYGLLRFVLPLFPRESLSIAPWIMVLGVISILYGAIVAYGQADFKRLVAYSTISHMGFVLIGIFAWNQLALEGVVMVMIAHSISASGLFAISGSLQKRLQTKDMQKMGGLWAVLPRAGGSTLVFALAGMGLPGLGNFVGEFLILFGVFQVNITIAVLATLGFVFSTVYSLWMIQRVFHGTTQGALKLPALSPRELAVLAVMIAIIAGLGLYPQPVLNTTAPSLTNMQSYTAGQSSSHSPTNNTLSQEVQP